MKIIQSKNTSTRKVLLVGMLVAIVLGVGACIYVYAYNGNILGWTKNEPAADSNINYEPATQEQKDEGLSAKEAFVDKYYSNTDEGSVSADNNATTTNEVSIIISSTSQTSETAQIRTIIQTVNNGTCTLTMTSPDANTINREVSTQNLGSYSTCKGFDIPLSELQTGTWDITIKYASDKESGTTSQKMEIKK